MVLSSTWLPLPQFQYPWWGEGKVQGKQTDVTWQTITLDSKLNLKPLPVYVIQPLTTQHQTILMNFIALLRYSLYSYIRLIFFLTAFTRYID